MNRGWKIAGCIALGALFLVLFGWVTMILWNWLVPSLFNGPVINFWQALGLLLLSKILFGGKSWHHRGRHHGPWRGRLYEKFSHMSPEQREVFKRKMKERWCHFNKENEPGGTDEPKVD